MPAGFILTWLQNTQRRPAVIDSSGVFIYKHLLHALFSDT